LVPCDERWIGANQGGDRIHPAIDLGCSVGVFVSGPEVINERLLRCCVLWASVVLSRRPSSRSPGVVA
jgi:hypothetical protein